MRDTLDGQVAIVTGGSRGYGAGIAEQLAAEGCSVWITARTKSDLQETADRIGAEFIQADVTDSEDWDRVFEHVLEAEDTLDILVNNAGAGVRIAPLVDQSDAEIRESIAVNLTGALLGSRRAAEVMSSQGHGTIINISSICEDHAWPGYAPYSAAKAGLAQFSDCLYTELREDGVRVTTLTPSQGATDFRAAAEGLTEWDEDTIQSITKPEELGDIVVYICQLPPHLEMQDCSVLPLNQHVEPL